MKHALTVTLSAALSLLAFDLPAQEDSYAVRPVSEASYGVYLMHMFILTPVSAALCRHLPTPLAIFATAAATFACASAAAILLRRIPVVGKWICG